MLESVAYQNIQLKHVWYDFEVLRCLAECYFSKL